jgi:hypothetical protein
MTTDDPKELLLFECEINDETFWVAAHGLWHAVEVLKSVEPDDSENDSVSVEWCQQRRAEAKTFTDDDGTKRSMWEQFKLQTEPGLIASTVF